VTHQTGRSGVERDIVLATRRLVLTTWLPLDVDALFEVHSEPETMKFVRYGRPESRAETEELVRQYIAEQAAQGWTKWRLADVSGELVGRAGFGGNATHRGISFAIRRSHWGLGLATEIAEALVGWHLSRAAAVPLGAIVAVGNDSSGRALQKVGFREVGTEDYDGTICRSFVYPSATQRLERLDLTDQARA
jgi:ribosomal-protein-alanine N-acetyltransferase